MPSPKFKNMVLVAFVVLTIIFGSLFSYEFGQVGQLKSSTITTFTTTVTSTPFTTSTTVATETMFTTSTITVTSCVHDIGNIDVRGIGYFAYKRLGC